jgi:hypothetical protein
VIARLATATPRYVGRNADYRVRQLLPPRRMSRGRRAPDHNGWSGASAVAAPIRQVTWTS